MASAIFDFDQQKQFMQSIEVEDLGNCALRCTNKDFEEYYVCSQTVEGKTFILKYGPIIPDMEALEDYFDLVYKKIDYDEKKISKEFSLLLNDAKKGINKVENISVTEALQLIPTPDKFIPNI